MFDKEEGNLEEDYVDFDQPDDGVESTYYAVAVGRTIGIYKSWPKCYDSTNGYRGACYQKFKTKDKAEEFLILKNRNGTKEEIEDSDSLKPYQLDRRLYSNVAQFAAASPTTSRASIGTTRSVRRKRRLFAELNMRPTLTELQQDPPHEINKDNTQEQLVKELNYQCPTEQQKNLTLLIDSGMTIEDIRGIIKGWRNTSNASSTKTNVQR